MSEIRDGGPAFPTPWAAGTATEGGMTLRDWIAGQAINSVASTIQAPPNISLKEVCEEIAKASYMVADAMLAARSGSEK